MSKIWLLPRAQQFHREDWKPQHSGQIFSKLKAKQTQNFDDAKVFLTVSKLK